MIVLPNITGLGFMGTVSQILLCYQNSPPNKKPLLPPLVHDDISRIFISTVGILICSYILYRLWRSLNEWIPPRILLPLFSHDHSPLLNFLWTELFVSLWTTFPNRRKLRGFLKMTEIHQSFIKSLLLVAVVTLVSMATARIIVNKVLSDRYKPSNFTLQKLPDHSDR